MSFDAVLALAGFAFVMSVSPGPGNLLLLTSGANFGLARTLPLVFGISFGFLGMVMATGLGLGQLLKAYPAIATVLRAACGIYVLWLAWTIARSAGPRARNAGEAIERPFTFLEAAALQLVNPKAWAVALVVTVSYLAADAPVSSLLVLIAIFAAVNIPSIGLWAVSGVGLRGFLAHGRRIAVFNVMMAALLVASILPVLLPAME
ncbi:LysE family translocator [Kaustia mangrovi]|uniref:LysE family translocator n=1 Tax=Kaustia mangrovi TaxID=2593653 RepID=A0A7S8C163_9HYPH|nr:LysE family translocator [Kaustia mangrovi]QPC41479.1 LysE family translocator [Kaustia mangrovi]